jgi:hypothetical protein
MSKAQQLRAELEAKAASLKNPAAAEAVAAAEQKAQATLEEKMAAVRARMHRLRLNWSQLDNRDPAKGYQWERNTNDSIAAARSRGWELVKTGSNAEVETPFRREDGTHVYGDLILMQIPRDEQEILELLPDVEAVERIHGRNQYQQLLAFSQENRVPMEVTE